MKVKGALVLPVEQTIHVALQVASIPAHNVSQVLDNTPGRCGAT